MNSTVLTFQSLIEGYQKTRNSLNKRIQKCIFNIRYVYAIGYDYIEDFYDSKKWVHHRDDFEMAFAIHYWNSYMKMTGKDLLLNIQHPLYQMFMAHCPNTEQTFLRRHLLTLNYELKPWN